MKVKHTIIRNSNLFCSHCGEEQVITYPIRPEMFEAMTKGFNKIHGKCEPTWKEPVADQSKSAIAKARWWWTNGERGSSSETMWYYFMDEKKLRADHPYDPDDFSRCYKLLQTVPEWRPRILELGSLSKEWKQLSENWDKLTSMFEENQRTKWKQADRIGMYEFMQTLIKVELCQKK